MTKSRRYTWYPVDEKKAGCVTPFSDEQRRRSQRGKKNRLEERNSKELAKSILSEALEGMHGNP